MILLPLASRSLFVCDIEYSFDNAISTVCPKFDYHAFGRCYWRLLPRAAFHDVVFLGIASFTLPTADAGFLQDAVPHKQR